MEEEIQIIIDSTIEGMDAAIVRLGKELAKIRAGKASPAMLESVIVDYYGTMTPISQVANISAPDGRTLIVQPWEKGMLNTIDKAIQAANLGFNPMNDGVLLRIIIPTLTEERRRDLSKMVKNEGETSKVNLRNLRRDANEEIKKLKKDGLAEDVCKDTEEKIQKITDKYIAKIEELLKSKENDIMKV